MALLSNLVNVVAQVEGLDETQVGWIARYLREAGLISQAGRGRGAARMTADDAANLIIAVNASTIPKQAAFAVETCRSLECAVTANPDFRIPAIRRGTEIAAHIFGTDREKIKFSDALICLMKACIRNDEIIDFENKFAAVVVFERPWPACRIDILEQDDDGARTHIISRTFTPNEFANLDTITMGDKYDETRITHKTLSAVGSAIAK